MPVSLKVFAESLARGEVSVRGQTLSFRLLCDAEADRLARLFPSPTPPMVKDPMAGSEAPKVPNHKDGAYLGAMQDWTERHIRVQIAAAFGLDGGAGAFEHAAGDAENHTRLEAAVREMSLSFTRAEIVAMWSAYIRILRGEGEDLRRGALIVDAALLGAEDLKGTELPERYATTATYAKLEVCHYFHISPLEVDEINPGLLGLMAAHVQLRRQEDAK